MRKTRRSKTLLELDKILQKCCYDCHHNEVKLKTVVEVAHVLSECAITEAELMA